MSNQEITFNDLPSAVASLVTGMAEIKELLSNLISNSCQYDRWLGIEQLSEYLPGSIAKTTIYKWAKEGRIPAHKAGKRWVFRQTEIDKWLLSQDADLTE